MRSRARHTGRAPPRQPARSPDSGGVEPPGFSLGAIPAMPAGPAAIPVGSPADPAEREADRAAERALRGESLRVSKSARRSDARPEARPPGLAGSGQALDPAIRAAFEPSFGTSFAEVRIHTDSAADAAAREMDASAFTLGRRIGFGANEYAPGTPDGRRLLAHELAHVAQDGGASDAAPVIRRRQAPDGGTPPPPPPPRLDYVFIMGPIGESRNDFYRRANAFYQARLPGAVFVLSETSLTGVLDYLAGNVSTPAANIYIVSHGNEDGTLAFGLDPADADAHMDVGELRSELHPAAGGASGLADVSAAVDAATRIHIKGCDIGRTGEMVELLDESFGGAGTVTAPTHEQVYEWDEAAGTAARGRERTRLMDEFRATLPEIPPMPAPVDRSLRGPARTAARAERTRLIEERNDALRQRRADIRAEEARIVPELDVFEAQAAVSEELSGPMFQRPGTTRFVAADLTPEVNRLYPHLSARQRASMVRRLVARARAPRRAAIGDVTGLRGQHVFRVAATSHPPFPDPRTLAQLVSSLGPSLPENFAPTALSSTTRSADNIHMVVEGTLSEPGESPRTTTVDLDQPFASDAELIAEGQDAVNNPGRYSWRVVESHRRGMTTRNAVAERVVAYLYHENLSPGRLPPFNPPETDPDFYATSTFAPPPPPPAPTTP